MDIEGENLDESKYVLLFAKNKTIKYIKFS